MHWNGQDLIEPSALNALGEQGWELVSVVFFENSELGWYFHYYFKRPTSEEED
jgi:hypothetical protein